MGKRLYVQRRSYLLLNGREVLCPEKKLPFQFFFLIKTGHPFIIEICIGLF
jgi:hypothetical protein